MKGKRKFLLLTIVLFLAFNSIEAQKLGRADAIKDSVMNIKEATYDFGTVKQNTRISKTFEFVNDGTEPLMIRQVKNSKVCVVAKYPKKAIKPGKISEITVKCNLSEVASEDELIAIMTNAVNGSNNQKKGIFELRIKGVVKYK